MHKISSNSLFVGKNIIHLPKCHSTNTLAAELLSWGNVQEGTIIVADHQTAGRGQRGSTWESEPGLNLTFSLILKPTFLAPNEQFFLTIVSSLAVQAVIRAETSSCKVKWPNDLYAGERKICGMLIENTVRGSRIDSAVIGIGLNVNQQAFTNPGAVSLRQLTGQVYDLSRLLDLLAQQLEAKYLLLKAGGHSQLKSAYLENLFGLGTERDFEDAEGVFRGKINGVTGQGQLLIEKTSGQLCTYAFKQVRFLHP